MNRLILLWLYKRNASVHDEKVDFMLYYKQNAGFDDEHVNLTLVL